MTERSILFATSSDSIDRVAQEQHEELSRRVFSNPTEFLDTLAANFNKIDRCGKGEVSKNELEKYAHSSEDPRQIALASTAAAHFDELKAMRRELPRYATRDFWHSAKVSESLTLENIYTAQDAENGRTEQYVERDRHDLLSASMEDGLMAGLCFF